MKATLKYYFNNYFEIAAFSAGLLLLVFMDPAAANGPSFCLFEQLGITFCPGDGLGHSIAYTFEGEIGNALESNLLGPAAIVVIVSRIVSLILQKINHIQD